MLKKLQFYTLKIKIMKKLLAISAFFVLATAFVYKTNIEPMAIGAAMPLTETKFKNVLTDKEITLKDCKGTNGTLVVFSCNTCPFVVANETRYNALQKYCIGYGIGLVIVNSNEAKRSGDDSEASMKAYATKNTYVSPYIIDKDSKLADAMGATVTPECFLFDKTNKLVYHGAIDDSPRDKEKVTTTFVAQAMEALEFNKPIAVPKTKGIGCGIKRNK
jgi:thioredoxin-related protein